MPQSPDGYKAGTLSSRYRLPPTHCRFLVSHSIFASIHSLIFSAISQWLLPHSPCSSLSCLPHNPLLSLMSSRRPLISSRRMTPILEWPHPTALLRRWRETYLLSRAINTRAATSMTRHIELSKALRLPTLAWLLRCVLHSATVNSTNMIFPLHRWRDEGYSYFGTEYSTECYCDDGLRPNTGPLPDSDCSMTCAGNPSETCGGPGAWAWPATTRFWG